MNPVIALVGRPNVGKSTLFNRLTKTRDALVADFPGLTRDRKYGTGKVGGKPYTVIDTGGISGDEEGIDLMMAGQSLAAIDEADIVLFMVDARAGLNMADEAIANHLRVNQKKTWLVVNKTDGMDEEIGKSDFWTLGLGDPRAIAAEHGRNVTTLLEEVLSPYPEVEVPFERRGKPYLLVDTAGIRRRKNVREVVEKFSIIKTLEAIKKCNVAVMVLDARQGLVEQDLHLLDFVLTSGRALVLVVNKWDGLESEAKEKMRSEIKRRLGFADYADLHFISALHGTAVGDLYPSIDRAFESAVARWSTKRLTTLLQDATQAHQPPMVNGRRIKLRMAHQGGANPPLIVVHGNQSNRLPEAYKRYLTNTFRKVLKVKGTPMRFEFRSGDNPFDGAQGADDRERAKERSLARTKEARKERKQRR